jgi:predicted permease
MAVCSALLTTVFAVVDGVLFKPLGYPSEHQLFAVDLRATPRNYRQSVAGHDLEAWTRAMPGVRLTGFSPGSAARVQQNFFDVFGVRPSLGGFAVEDYEVARPAIAPYILMHDVFTKGFGADPGVIGRVVITDPAAGTGFRIVGVMPAGFQFPADVPIKYITPMVEAPGVGVSLSNVVARVSDEAIAEELELRVRTLVTATNADRPGTGSWNHPIERVAVVPLGDALGAGVRPLFTSLLVAAALLVLIGGLNASSLLASRVVDRHREFAVRRALGAGARDIGTLLVTEAGLLLGIGAVAGLVLSVPVLSAVSSLVPERTALFREAAVDWRVVLFSGSMTVGLALLVSIWPFVIAGRLAVGPGADRSDLGAGRSTGMRLVITSQVTIAFVLAVGGALLVGSLLSVYAKVPALTTDDVLMVELRFSGMPERVAREAPERGERVEALVERIRAVPGVDSASLTAYHVLIRAYEISRFVPPRQLEGRSTPAIEHAVSSGFYRTIAPHLVEGRLPTDEEDRAAAPVVVVSERLARAYWPDSSAVGKTVENFQDGSDSSRMTFTIVGVVKDIPWALWDEEPTATYYGPYRLLARQTTSTLLVKSRRHDSQFAGEIRRAITEADPMVVIERAMPLEAAFTDSVRPRRFRAWLFGSFATAALVVVGLGIFGQLAMTTARRTREVGLRMALGATPGGIAGLIVREQLWPVLAGLVCGGILASWATRFVIAYLYEVTATDLRVWFAATILITLTAIAGTLVPSLRASRVNPNEARRVP